MQSRGWFDIQARAGQTIRDGMIEQKLGPFFYWYAPRALPPKVDFGDALFVRFDPPTEGGTYAFQSLSDWEPRHLVTVTPAPHDIQPRTTIILDLSKSREQLQKEMHHKCRYNIGVAERHGVRIQLHGREALSVWHDLLQKTAARDQFRPHPKAHYDVLFEPTTDSELKMTLAVAYVQDQPAAAAIIGDYGPTRTYLHGASDYAQRDKMAPYALHWYLIKDAQAQGMKAYDFWGIAPTDDPTEPLAGVTRFKKSWGGEVVRYPRTMDLVLRPFWYNLYRFVHRILGNS